MNILIEVGVHETEKLEELISSTKMTHEECFGGEIEKSFSENVLKLTCKKCGTTHQIGLSPGSEDHPQQKARIELINFLLNPSCYYYTKDSIYLIYPESQKEFINRQKKKESQKKVFLLGVLSGFIIIPYLFFSAISPPESLLDGIIFLLSILGVCGILFVYTLGVVAIYEIVYVD